MPTYVFECPECGTRKEKILLSKDRDSFEIYCDNHKLKMKRVIALNSYIQNDIEPYFDENLTNDATESGKGVCQSYDDRDHQLNGVFITSRRQKRELMKRWGYEFAADIKTDRKELKEKVYGKFGKRTSKNKFFIVEKTL